MLAGSLALWLAKIPTKRAAIIKKTRTPAMIRWVFRFMAIPR